MCSRCVSYMFDQVCPEVLTSLPDGMSIDHDCSQKTDPMSCANLRMTESFEHAHDVTAALPPTVFLVPIFFVHCIERQEFLSCNVGLRR